MITLSDERLDLEVTGFLRDEAEDLYGTPDARDMARRIVDADRSLGRRWARLFARPMFRLAIVGMLLAAALGSAYVIGATRSRPALNGQLMMAPWQFFDPAKGVYSKYSLCQAWCDDAGLGFSSWSRDGRQVAFVDLDGTTGAVQSGKRGWSIWRFDAGTRTLSNVVDCPANGACAWPSFSVDGRSIAYVELDRVPGLDPDYLEPRTMPDSTQPSISHLVAMDLATGATRRASPATGNLGTTGWTADGHVLAAFQPGNDPNEQRQLLFDLDTGQATEPVSRWPYAPARVSPDGTTIAYITYPEPVKRDGILRPNDNVYEVWVGNVDGSGLHRIHVGTPAYIQMPPTWSPDGQELAISVVPFAEDDPDSYLLDVQTGAVTAAPPGLTLAWLPAQQP